MNTPTPAHLEWARRCLAEESGTGLAEGLAPTAAARVYDKLVRHMAPLVGEVGVQLLFVRSAKLTRGELAGLSDISILEGATKLRATLLASDPAISDEAAAALFATFFALLTNLIGERLTTQVVGRAWLGIDDGTRVLEKQK